MRFSAVHKLASYLMAAAAFVAAAGSGELSPVISVAIALGFFASWVWEPPRIRLERFETAWNLATAACFLYVLADFFRPTGTLLSSGVTLLAFLLTNKLFNRRGSKDYLQLYVISFLLLVAGTSLNTELSYALCFFGYIVFATWALTLFHLRREMEESYLLKHSGDEQPEKTEKIDLERILSSRRIIGGPFLAGTSAVSLAIFAGALAVFFLFPRVGLGFFFSQKRRAQTMAGFSERVDLGMHGAIKDNPQVVMRIEFPRRDGRSVPPLHLRGIAFDRYERNGQWLHTRNARSPLALADGIARAPGSGHGEGTPDLVADIYLEPLSSRVLFGPSRTVAFELPEKILTAGPHIGLLFGEEDEVYATERPSGFRYTTHSSLAEPLGPRLDAASEAQVPPPMRRYLQLPPDLSPRVSALAQAITAHAQGPYGKAVAIRDYLQARYRYTTRIAPQHSHADPLANFLFETRAGHCEYFATAMAVLLRTVGVPTREVNGFYGGEWNRFGNYLAVRQMDAHAWVEVWFPHAGWLTFDPTPPAGAMAHDLASGWLSRFRQLEDSIELAWYKHMVEYNFEQQVQLAQGAQRFSRLLWRRHGASVAQTGRRAALTGAGALGLFVAWRLLARRRRTGGRRQGVPRRAGLHDPALLLYRKVLKRCARRGVLRAEAQTPGEFARALTAQAFPGAPVVAEVTALYYRSRFGGQTASHEELHALRQKLDLIGQAQ